MRKITKLAIEALYAGKYFIRDNTEVVDNTMYLHSSAIARVREPTEEELVLRDKALELKPISSHHEADESLVLEIRTAGFPTRTTMERLNGLIGVSVNQHKGELYLNGEVWDNHESWTMVI